MQSNNYMPPFLAKLVRVVLALALAAAALIVASLFVVLAVAVALAVGGWLWWRTRRLRRAAPGNATAVIEGEYRVLNDTKPLNR
jgi:hypothetical protein